MGVDCCHCKAAQRICDVATVVAENNYTILIVEPALPMRRLLKEMLLINLRYGRVNEAGNGQAALDLLNDVPVDLVICEATMEPMDGLGLIKAIRAGSGDIPRDLPILVVSGNLDMPLVHRLRDAGANEILAKPVSVQGLSARINAIFNRPRDFIESTVYTGPDRRRRRDTVSDDQDRRQGRSAGTEAAPAQEAGTADSAQTKSA